MDMFDTLNKGLVNNAVYDIKEGGSIDVVNASRASAFVASAICQLYIAEKVRNNKIVDFVRQALGLDKHYNFIKSIQSDNENLREKLSFEELSGIKNIKNVKSPSADKKDPIIERNEPTR